MPDAELRKAPRSRALTIRTVATLLVVALVGLAAFMLTNPSERPRTALIGGAFALQDGAGKTVSDETLKGKRSWSISVTPIAPTSVRPSLRASRTS